jgi:hypothetical protein
LAKPLSPQLPEDPIDSDDVDFFYLLEKHGWSTCYIHVDKQMYCMGPTHIFGNPLSVLLEKLSDPRQSRGFILVSPSKGQKREAPEGAASHP